MQPNSFSAAQVGYPQSGILAVNDFVRPDFQNKLFLQYGDQFYKDYLFMLAMGGKKGTKNAEGGFHFEEDRYDEAVTVLANAGTGAQSLVFTLDTSEIVTVSGDDYVYPVVGQTLWDPATNTIGRIISVVIVDGVSVTITATRLSGPTYTAPAAGKQFALLSNAQPENSIAPDPQNSYWTKITYQLQTFRNTATTTDLALGDELYAEIDEMGRFVGNWGGVSETQNEYRHMKAIFGALVLGSVNNVAGQPSTTDGYYNVFSAGSNTVDVLTGNYIDHLYTLIDKLKENSPMSSTYIGLICRNIINDYQTDLRAVYPDSNIKAIDNQEAQYIFGGNTSLGQNLRMDFQKAMLSGFTMIGKSFDVSYDPNVTGLNAATNQNLFANTAYWIQGGDTSDAQGNTYRPIQMRYLEIPGINGNMRSIYIKRSGLFASEGDNNQAQRSTYFYSNWGNEFFNLKQTGFWYKSALS